MVAIFFIKDIVPSYRLRILMPLAPAQPEIGVCDHNAILNACPILSRSSIRP